MEENYLVEVRNKKITLWDALANISIESALETFLKDLKYNTKRSYRSSFKSIFNIWETHKLLHRKASLQVFAHANMEYLLDCIRDNVEGSEATKQNRCAGFIAFTKYLHRITGRMIAIAIPKGGTNATFKKIRNKAATRVFSHEEWAKFCNALKNICLRDYLIAKAIYQGAKRCGEVLQSKIEDIDWEKSAISYKQLKSHALSDTTFIYYSPDFMTELKNYLNGRVSGFIFTTKNGKAVAQAHLYRAFAYASVVSGLKFRIHPHMLRASAITSLMRMGYHSDQIMYVSGHSSPSMVIYYDKTPIEENITRNIKLC